MENFENWNSGNEGNDELIQHSQLNAVHCRNCLEWIPFENFQEVTYITRGGFGKIYRLNGLKDIFVIGILKINNGTESRDTLH